MISAVSSRTASGPFKALKFLVLVTDAFGGRGGIAQFNRDLIGVLCNHPATLAVRVLPRVIADQGYRVPDRLVYEIGASQGKAAYLYHFGKVLAQRDPFAAVVCAHVHLLPLAAIAARQTQAPLILIIHGVEAWQPPRTLGLRFSLRAINQFVSVSNLTKHRFLTWAALNGDQGHVIPNCVDTSRFSPGNKPEYLLRRYGLTGRRQVLLTVARLSTPDRYKGIDEVLEVIPSLLGEMPDLTYVIAGDGQDRHRLESKAAELRITPNVVFTGYIAEEEKADHYRLADAFVMPGRGEGFGIVYLEAMACGIPVVASKADASREAVLEGRLGQIVDPGSPDEIRAAIRISLQQRHAVPQGLEYFSVQRFTERWHATLNLALAGCTKGAFIAAQG